MFDFLRSLSNSTLYDIVASIARSRSLTVSNVQFDGPESHAETWDGDRPIFLAISFLVIGDASAACSMAFMTAS